MNNTELIKQRILDSVVLKEQLVTDNYLLQTISKIADAIINSICTGGKLVVCGNGGSASDALHFAGEIIGRFMSDRNPWPAVVLNADVATMTAIANDYGYDEIFARQAKAMVNKGDVFVGITTSGNSNNVLRACVQARENGAKVVCLTGRDGGLVRGECDMCVMVPSEKTARIQECHILIIHILCEIIESNLISVD